MSVAALSVGRLRTIARVRTAGVLLAGFTLAAGLALALSVVDPSADWAVFEALFLIPLPALFWRVPVTATLVPVATALLFEQSPTGVGDQLTENVHLFETLNTSLGLGVAVSPAEIILASALLTLLLRAVAQRDVVVKRSMVSASLAVFVLLLLVAMAHGRAVGGSTQIIFDQVRPFGYLVAMYVLASQAMRTRSHLWSVLWVAVLVTGVKGLQGTYRYVTLPRTYPPPESLLSHEEAVFLTLFILLTAGLWLFGVRGRLRVVATALLPLVVTADLANQRRSAWVLLAVGVVLLLVSAWIGAPQRRRVIMAIAVGTAVFSAAYFPLFWNSSSTLAQPARALRSSFNPDPRDYSSDVYRLIETTDLGIDIRTTGPLGYGFGRAIPHPIPLPYDASQTVDPLIDYIPHNTILGLWLCTGLLGALAFWFLIGSAILAACRVVRGRDRRLPTLGAYALCAVAAYAVEGWYDKGLAQDRTAILVGCVLGGLEAARRLTRAGEPVAP